MQAVLEDYAIIRTPIPPYYAQANPVGRVNRTLKAPEAQNSRAEAELQEFIEQEGDRPVAVFSLQETTVSKVDIRQQKSMEREQGNSTSQQARPAKSL